MNLYAWGNIREKEAEMKKNQWSHLAVKLIYDQASSGDMHLDIAAQHSYFPLDI